MSKRPTAKGGGFTPSQKRAYTRELKRRLALGQTEDYARRQARGKALGRTQQEARGHTPPPEGEARHRKRLEAERGLLHYSQKQSIRRFAERQADRMEDADPDAVNEQMQAWAQAHGYAAFLRLREQVNKLGSEKRRRVRRRIFRGERGGRVMDIRVDISGRSANRDLMDQLAEDWELGSWRWLFYH